MTVHTYPDAKSFLLDTLEELEANEAANSLILGVCLRMMRFPEQVKTLPCLKTVTDETGLVLAAMMTPPHKMVVYGHQGDLDEGAGVLMASLLKEGWQVPGILGPRDASKCVAGRWSQITGRQFRLQGRQTVHELRQIRHRSPKRGQLRTAELQDLDLVANWRHDFHLEVFGEADLDEDHQAAERSIQAGDVYLWDDEIPASMAMRTRPTRNGISVSLVYTPPELRGRGYASTCVGELCRLLLKSGWDHCALFADATNTPALKVYQKLGFVPICDYDDYLLLDEK